MATGKSGPLAKYMTEDMYVSAVTSECVSAVAESVAGVDAVEAEDVSVPEEIQVAEASETKKSVEPDKTFNTSLNKLLESVLTISKVISLIQQSAREAVKTCLEMILPFMGFAALFIGICKGSGLTQFLAGLIQPMGGSLPGLLGLGIICSIPGLSAILGAGAVAAQMFSTVIGELIAAGSIPAFMALPALFAINCQCACDFIPVGLGMTEAKPETTQVGIAAITMSRFVTGWIRILIAVVFSIGLYR
jgi:PTS system glucitol/sorbitol-specific IIC component